MAAGFVAIAVVLFLVILFLISAIKVAREYERGIVFRLGRLFPEPKGPGLFVLIPVVDRMVKVDLRTITLNIPPQEVITKDNVPVRVNAVAYFRIVAPKDALVQVENFMVATSQKAQTTLRSVLGQHVLDELLSEREKIHASLQEIIDEATGPWGIKVSAVEVKDVEIPAGMQRAMARQAEAERERRAKVINAEGEYQASERLKDAALVIEGHPTALQLRYLQTLLELDDDEVAAVAEAWQARREAALTEGFAYVHALINEGVAAGSSLPHSHSQLVWLRERPPEVAQETGDPAELLGELVIAERGPMRAAVHRAGRLPYETLIGGEPFELGG